MKIDNWLKSTFIQENWFRINKIVNLLISYSPKFSKSINMPISADIEPTIQCNLNCIMCHRKELLKNRKKLSMNFLNFKKIINQLPSLVKINLQGMGEPLLAKDLFKMIKYARGKGILVSTFTNGVLLNKSMSVKLIKSGINRVYVSLDSNDCQQYKKLRGKEVLKQVKKNISLFINERNIHSKNSCKIGIWMLLLKDNFDQIIPLVDFAEEEKIDSFTVQTILKNRGKENWIKRINSLKYKPENILNNQLLKIKNYTSKLKIEFNFFDEPGGFLKKDYRSLCNWPWKSLYITNEGDIVPCCIISDPKTISLGNILKNNFKTIWNNQSYIDFRNKLLKGDIPNYCKFCYSEDFKIR